MVLCDGENSCNSSSMIVDLDFFFQLGQNQQTDKIIFLNGIKPCTVKNLKVLDRTNKKSCSSFRKLVLAVYQAIRHLTPCLESTNAQHALPSLSVVVFCFAPL